jgi:hypothetical protein
MRQIHIIVTRGEPLNDNEVEAAFKSLNNQQYAALVQLINDNRGIFTINAGAAAAGNNPLAMAWNNGSENALGQLLGIIDDLRLPEKD